MDRQNTFKMIEKNKKDNEKWADREPQKPVPFLHPWKSNFIMKQIKTKNKE